MPLVGIDLGSQCMTIALALRGGIDVVANEFSKRSSPTLVSFTENNRVIGENAVDMVVSNINNTIHNVKRILGLKYSEIPKEEFSYFPNPPRQGPNDEAYFEVSYLGKKMQITPLQIVAMLLTKAKETVEKEAQAVGVEAVISIPPYYLDKQRRAVYQAAEIAGIHVVSLIHDCTAAAVEYGIYRDIPDKQTVNVGFVDVGHSDTSVSIMSITKTQIRVRSTNFHQSLGGRDFDHALLGHIIELCKQKYKIDPNSSLKHKLKLMREVEKLKKVLSINPKGQLRMECFMEDKDISFEVTREQLETLCEPVLNRFVDPIKKAINDCGLKLEEITSVELIGGGSYIPSLRKMISQAFNMTTSQTLNASESIARGCAFQGAMITPYFRLMKEIQVLDNIFYPINLGYKKSDMAVENTSEVDQISKQSALFKYGECTPNTKLLTFSRSGDFDLYSLYAQSALPQGHNPLIGKATISKVPQKQSTVKVQVRHNLSGIFVVESAELVEEIEVPESTPQPAKQEPAKQEPAKQEQQNQEKGEQKDDGGDKMETTEATEQKAKDAPPKLVKKTIKTALPVVYRSPYDLTPEQMEQAKKLENQMREQDRLVSETAEAKNNVESFIYRYKDKIYGDLSDYFASEDERAQYEAILDKAEEWFFGDGEEASKEDHIKKYLELKSQFESLDKKKAIADARPAAVSRLLATVDSCKNFIASKDEKYSHIDETERRKLREEMNQCILWLNEQMDAQSKLPLSAEPVLTPENLKKKEDELIQVYLSLINKPKPKPKEEEKKEEKKDEKQQTKDVPKQEQKNENEPTKANGGDNMETE